MNILIVLTDRYPYGQGEVFIEGERNFWQIFDHVYICPVLACQTDSIRDGFSCTEKESLIDTYDDVAGIYGLLSGLFGGISLRRLLSETRQYSSSPSKIKTVLGAFLLTNKRAKRIIRRLKKEFDDSCCNILIYSYWMYEPALTGTVIKNYLGSSRFITRAHGYDLYEERQPKRFFPFRKYLFETVDAIFPISENGREYLSRKYNRHLDNKISVERLGTLKEFNDYGGEEIFEKITIVSCSNMVPLKRIHRIIEMLPMLNQECDWYHFGDGELMGSLKAQSKSLPHYIHVHFMGRVPNTEIQRFYSTHFIDVFVNVSETEGVPVSIMEAQSYGLPVVATDVGGTSELINNSKNGVLLRKDFTNEEFIRAVKECIENKAAFRMAAKSTWESLSDANKIYHSMFQKELHIISLGLKFKK